MLLKQFNQIKCPEKYKHILGDAGKKNNFQNCPTTQTVPDNIYNYILIDKNHITIVIQGRQSFLFNNHLQFS